jgi:folylpolyglutamate synthase/dihydropteroate synthase
VDGAPVVACLALLADKDAPGVLAALAPRIELAVCTELPADRLARAGRPAARSLGASRLAEAAVAAGIATEIVAEPVTAVRRAVAEANARSGATLVSGSHYLLRYAVEARSERGDSPPDTRE